MRGAVLLLLLAPALAGCAGPEVEVRARLGDFAVLDLQAWDGEGAEVLNLPAARGVLAAELPPRLPAGWDRNGTLALPPAVREALVGASPGRVIDTLLEPPERAFGNRSAERTIAAPRLDRLPRVVTVAADAVEGGRARWANHTWSVEVAGRNGSLAEVRLVGGPGAGALLEVPVYWNEHYQLWRSRLLGLDPDELRVEHLPEAGRTVLVGGVPHVLAASADRAVADANPPLAGRTLRFRAELRELAAAPAGRPAAVDAVLVGLEGGRFNLSDLRGQPVLLDFFATWCVTCRVQAPVLAQAHAAYGDRVRVLSVTIDPTDTADRVRAFQREVGATWGFAFDPTGDAARGFHVATIPREVLLDAQGRVTASSAGVKPWPELRDDLQAVAQQGGLSGRVGG